MIKAGGLFKFYPKRVETEKFIIDHIVFTEEKVKFERLRSLMGGQGYETMGLTHDVSYTRLLRKCGGLVMSDTPMEINTNREFVDKAHGHVLVGGLGLGLIIASICEKPEVRSITVVEKEQEVIELVGNSGILDKTKCNITVDVGDILIWRPPEGDLYDTIYFDIWDEICEDNNVEMKRLHRVFWRYLNRKENPESWMTSWRLSDVRRLAYA